MRPRNVCLLGGYGFVGSHLCAALARAGYRATVLAPRPERAKTLRVLPAIKVVRCDVHDEAQLVAAFRGHDAVVNLVGIYNETGRSGAGFRRVHGELTRKIVTACREAGVDRLLQMSGLRADADNGPSHYLRSKGEAERVVRDEGGPDLRWTIFQPSVIFGAGDTFMNKMAGLLRRVPLALPLARADARLSPVWVEDVVEAMVRALEDDDTAGECYELCGPEVFTLRELVVLLRDELGLRKAVIGLPDPLARLQGAIMDFVPGKPFSTDNFQSLTVDSVCSSNGFARLGLRPHGLRAVLPHALGLEGSRRDYDRFRRGAHR
jgi:NADH dehydrogenase